MAYPCHINADRSELYRSGKTTHYITIMDSGRTAEDSMGEPISCFSEVRALIFDLDGTLIDSKLDLALAVNAVLAEMGRGPRPRGEILGYSGQGARNLNARALGDGASEDECRR